MEFSQLLGEVDSVFSRGSSLVEVHKAIRDLHVFDREFSDKGIVDYFGSSDWSVRVFQNPVSYVLRRQLKWNGYNRVAAPDGGSLSDLLEFVDLWSSQNARGSEVSLGLQRFLQHEVAVDGSIHFQGQLSYSDKWASVYAVLSFPPVSLEVRVGLLPVSASKVA